MLLIDTDVLIWYLRDLNLHPEKWKEAIDAIASGKTVSEIECLNKVLEVFAK